MPTQISGTTGVSRVQDGAVLQDDLANGVVGKGPAFSAYQSVAQTIGPSVWTKLNLQSEEFDTSSAFDSLSTYRFTPQLAGYYQLEGTFSASSSGGVAVGVYKNGVLAKTGGSTTANTNGVSVSCLVYMNGTTDYVELWGFAAVGQSLPAQAPYVYFQGFLARAA